MEIFRNKGNRQEPEIELNKKKNIFTFKGRSIVSNPIEFYEPIIDWAKEYCRNPNEKTLLRIELDYFNSSSFKALVDLFKEFSVLKDTLLIQWVTYKDDDIVDEAEKIIEITGLNIEFIYLEE